MTKLEMKKVQHFKETLIC